MGVVANGFHLHVIGTCGRMWWFLKFFFACGGYLFLCTLEAFHDSGTCQLSKSTLNRYLYFSKNLHLLGAGITHGTHNWPSFLRNLLPCACICGQESYGQVSPKTGMNDAVLLRSIAWRCLSVPYGPGMTRNMTKI